MSLLNSRDVAPMSFSICNNDKQILNFNNKETVIAYQNKLLSYSPKYIKKTANAITRINLFTNKLPIRLLNYQSYDYTGRYLFRRDFSKLILGYDYNFDIINRETFRDGTLGEEVYYEIINNYEINRVTNLMNGFNNFQSKYNKSNLNDYFKDVFYFYDALNNNDGFNGVLYFDHTYYNNIHYPGIECLIPYFSHYLEYKGSYLVNNEIYYPKEKTYDLLDASINCLQNNIYKEDITKSV